MKFSTFDDGLAFIQTQVRLMYQTHRQLLASGILEPEERADYEALLNGTAPATSYQRALEVLSRYLARQSGEQVVILIDAYDTPLHAAFVHGYYDRMVEFMRAFLSGGGSRTMCTSSRG